MRAQIAAPAMSRTPEVEWAVGQLQERLVERGIEATVHDGHGEPGSGDLSVRLSSARGRAEAYTRRIRRTGSTVVCTLTGDGSGLKHGLVELADIVRYADDPMAALTALSDCDESPASRVRGITRLFTSELEDLPWLKSRPFWSAYLDELASQRFNQFTLAFGLGYDYLIDKLVKDPYLCFLYPYVVDVPSYDVHVDGLAASERDNNLEMLRHIGQEAKRRGIAFRLGLWNHAYDYGPLNCTQSWQIVGLSAENHSTYCRDALAALLRACPEVSGVTFRVHFEGGVPEPTHEFWREVLSGVRQIDTLKELDFHSKGVDSHLIETAESTGKKVTISTKYWAEHMGPPYHQASIRGREFGRDRGPASTGSHNPRAAGTGTTAKRSFTRYGYADHLREDRSYGVVHRIWPGTQRVLLWGDPVSAAGIGRHAGFGGSDGVEWFDPLSFKGKKGSGVAGGREIYRDPALRLGIEDWKKFSYTYRLWGRLAYNPEADAECWRRYLRAVFGPAWSHCETALAHATRVLPFALLVHGPSAAGNIYWPEMYTNIPIVRGSERRPNPCADLGWHIDGDFDTLAPYNFQNTSPFDPVLVYSVNEFVSDLIAGRHQGKLTPLAIADRFADLSSHALQALALARETIVDDGQADFVRLATDVEVVARIGGFFAEKFRAATSYALFEELGGRSLVAEALAHYRLARAEWRRAARAADPYVRDITFGQVPHARGHWEDRLPAIDADIAQMADQLAECEETPTVITTQSLLARLPTGAGAQIDHSPPVSFVKGDELPLSAHADGATVAEIILNVRRVDQSEEYWRIPMNATAEGFYAVIPGEYTDSLYDLQYFFEIRSETGHTWFHPGFDAEFVQSPYYVLEGHRRARQ